MGEVAKYGPPCDQCGQPEGDHRVFAMDHGFRRKESPKDAVTTAIDAVWESRSIADRRDAVAALIAAAHSEGARQERERIRGLELDENVRGLLKGVMHAIHHMPWSTSAWRALLAAITQASEANTHDGAAVTEGE